eukprot:525397-Hanusia_phi.AAC.4
MPLHSLPRFLCLGTILVASAVTLFHKDNYRVLLLLQFLQIVAGCFGALICFVRLMKERDLYLEAKQTLRIADESRKLVHSLIPENVMTKLVHHGNAGEFLGANIPFCIVMFCSLGPQQLLKSKTSAEIFEILDQVFEKFDDAVDNHGMYKYQNVGDWYIIMCPRAARPFDQKLQEEPYPRSHVRSMVHLAAELIRIAKNHEVQGTKLNLKIGMHCGPAAGAVVGSHRAFYCVYGDTTNTAARMCKYAGSDQILCTCSFAKIAGGCRGLPFSFEAKGVISVKGKGAMELYEVHERGSGGVGKELRRGLKRTTSVPNPSEKCVMFDQEQAIKLEEIQPTWMGAIEEAAGESGSSGAGAGAGAGAAGQAGISSDTIPFWTNFSDSDTEVKFLLDQARDHWLSISIGVLVHAYALLAAVEEAVTADSLQPIHYLSLYLQILLILTYFLFVLFYMIPELQFCHKFGHSIFSFQLLVSITHLLVGVNLRLLLCFYSILQYSAINLVLTGFTRSDAAIVVMLGAISLLPGYRMDHDFLLLSCFVLLTVSLALTVWKSKCLVYNEKVRYQYYEFIELELTRMKEEHPQAALHHAQSCHPPARHLQLHQDVAGKFGHGDRADGAPAVLQLRPGGHEVQALQDRHRRRRLHRGGLAVLRQRLGEQGGNAELLLFDAQPRAADAAGPDEAQQGEGGEGKAQLPHRDRGGSGGVGGAGEATLAVLRGGAGDEGGGPAGADVAHQQRACQRQVHARPWLAPLLLLLLLPRSREVPPLGEDQEPLQERFAGASKRAGAAQGREVGGEAEDREKEEYGSARVAQPDGMDAGEGVRLDLRGLAVVIVAPRAGGAGASI